MQFRCFSFLMLLLVGINAFSQDYSRNALKQLSLDSLENLAHSRQKLPLDTTQVRIFSMIGSKYLYADNVMAKKYALKTMALGSKINFHDGVAAGRNNLAMIALIEGDANKAYQLLKTNQVYFLKQNNDEQLGTNFLNIGVIHGSLDEFEKAIACFHKAIHHFTKADAGNSKLAGCYSMIANAYSYMGNQKASIQNYHKALKLETDDKDIVSILNNVGNAFSNFKQYDSAMYYYKRSIQKNQTVKSSYNEMNSLNYIGSLYLIKKQPAKALAYFNKALLLSEAENNLETKISANKNLSEAYQQLGNFKMSLDHYKRYGELKDSLNKSSSIDEVKKIEAKFELERQDAKLVLLENQKKLNEAELRKSKIVIILGGAVLLLFVALSWYWYSRHKIKKKMNLQQQEQFITDLKLKEAESNLEGQLVERKRLAQELHDGLGATLAGAKLTAIALLPDENDQGKSFIASLDKACSEVRLISHNLIPPEFSKDAFESIIKRLVQNYAVQNEIQLHLSIEGAADLDRMDVKQKTMVYRILQETITNALKHANCSSISLLMTAFDDYVNIIIEDDGIGFDPAATKQGIGLQNIRTRISELGSELTIDSALGKGTVMQFDVPLKK